jgi:hypothetical protein
LFDGIDEAGEPYFDPGHPRLTDEERALVVRFLDSGTVVGRTSGRDVDRVDRSRGNVVPLTDRTDGTWLWTGGVRYYAHEYGIAPEPEFLRHMAACEWVAVPADEQGKQEAVAYLRSRF